MNATHAERAADASPASSPAAPPPHPSEPTSDQIAREALVFALVFLVIGGLIVAIQVSRKGRRLLEYDPFSHRHSQPTAQPLLTPPSPPAPR